VVRCIVEGPNLPAEPEIKWAEHSIAKFYK
jgi:hypothetical protein